MKLPVDAHTHFPPAPPCGAALLNWPPAAALTAVSGEVHFSAGCHPKDADEFSCSALRKLLNALPASAVGECGLDPLAKPALDLQKEVFQQQIELALELALPMVIHCVKLPYEVIRFRKQFGGRGLKPWLIHSFRSNREIGTALLKAGCLLSLAPTWLMHLDFFPAWLPDGAFLLETDESAFTILELYQHTAALRGESVDQLTELLDSVFRRFLA